MKGVIRKGQIAAPNRRLFGGEVKTQGRPFVAQQVMDNCEGTDVAHHCPVVCKPRVRLEVWKNVVDAMGERTKDEREEESGQRVPLVDASAGLKDGGTEDEVGLDPIGGLDPGGKLGEVRTDLAKYLIPVDEVEGVLEVHLQDALLFQRDVVIGDESVEGVDYALAAAFDAHCKLMGLEKIGGARGNFKSVCLGNESTQRLSDGHRTKTPILLQGREQVGTEEVRGDRRRETTGS